MPSDLFTKWLRGVLPPTKTGVALYVEQDGARDNGLASLKKLLADHFVGEMTVLQAGGYEKSAAIIANSLPTNKRTRSGDLAELLATEYVDSETEFRVPIRKLCWKSDREMPMHGNDIVAVNAKKSPPRVLKGECKSRKKFAKDVVDEAAATLDMHDGRPNPSTLAFIAKRLYEQKRDEEANVFRDLQSAGAMKEEHLAHIVFALSGNDPSSFLAACPKPLRDRIRRTHAAVVIKDHGEFIEAAFKSHGTRP